MRKRTVGGNENRENGPKKGFIQIKDDCSIIKVAREEKKLFTLTFPICNSVKKSQPLNQKKKNPNSDFLHVRSLLVYQKIPR